MTNVSALFHFENFRIQSMKRTGLRTKLLKIRFIFWVMLASMMRVWAYMCIGHKY